MKKMTIGCVIAIVLIVVLVILLCVLFHYRIVMNPFGTTYKMTHDPKTKAEVEERIGVCFPDSVKWEQCYTDRDWSAFFLFCAKISISEKDINVMIPSEIDFEYFQFEIDDLPLMPYSIFSVLYDLKNYIHFDIEKFNNLEIFYYYNDQNKANRYLVFVIDRTNMLSDNRAVAYVYHSGWGWWPTDTDAHKICPK